MFNLWKNSGGGTNLSTYNILSQNTNTRIRKLNARATAISLNSIDEKVRSLEGTSKAVPIDMKSLDDRINNLIATAKEWQTVSVSESVPSSDYNITNKYSLKLNSNSLVTFKLNKEGSSNIHYRFNLKGNFTVYLGPTSQNTYIKRVGNDIYLREHYGGMKILGEIIILN